MNSLLRPPLLIIVQAYRYSSAAIHFLVGIFGFDTQCKFPESCSEFAMRQIQTKNQNVFLSLRRIALRLILCSPIGTWMGEGVKSRWMLVQ